MLRTYTLYDNRRGWKNWGGEGRGVCLGQKRMTELEVEKVCRLVGRGGWVWHLTTCLTKWHRCTLSFFENWLAACRERTSLPNHRMTFSNCSSWGRICWGIFKQNETWRERNFISTFNSFTANCFSVQIKHKHCKTWTLFSNNMNTTIRKFGNKGSGYVHNHTRNSRLVHADRIANDLQKAARSKESQ